MQCGVESALMRKAEGLGETRGRVSNPARVGEKGSSGSLLGGRPSGALGRVGTGQGRVGPVIRE